MTSVLEYVKINEFRHVRPGSVVEFGRGINVILGRNGAGKTALLGLVSALMRNNFHQFIRENFSISFRIVEDIAVLEGTLTNAVADEQADFRFVGDLVFEGERAHIESNGSASTISYRDRHHETRSVLPSKDERGAPPELMHAVRLALPNEPEFARLSQGRLGITGEVLQSSNQVIQRMTEGVETFNDLLEAESTHRDQAPTLGITFVAPDPSGPHGSNPPVCAGHHIDVDDDMLAHLRKTTWHHADTVTIGTELPMLAQFVELSQYKDATLILAKTSVSRKDGLFRWTFGNPLLRSRMANGNEIPHAQLSFGEKRLLAFLIKLYANRSTIVVDELANGMHHSWIEACVDLIEEFDTQAFLSSQNPLLLDCLPLSRDTFGTQHAVVVCEVTEAGEMSWRNLDGAEVEDFFESLEVGIQHISEIMRSKGLW